MGSLFDTHSDEQIIEASKTAKPSGANAGTTARALDYLAGRMLEHVKSDLAFRYPSTQDLDSGQAMMPQAVPLVERFVSEEANVYDKGAKRKLVDEYGEETDATRNVTTELNRLTDSMALDESMHLLDQVQNTVDSCGGWIVVKRGRVQMRLVPPHESRLVEPESADFDASDQRDYLAYLVDLGKGTSSNRFAWVARGETAYYEAHDANHVKVGKIESAGNPWMWPQVPDGQSESPTMEMRDLPVMPLIWWHRKPPLRRILPEVDATIAHVSHELNLAWSALLDVFRMQSFSTLVINQMDKQNAVVLHGARFPIKLGPGETAQYINSAVNYEQLVSVLIEFQQVCAVALRMSPNDFSLDQQAAMSGFAKLVDSLPKLEARHSRIRRLSRMESEYLWPVLGAILVWQGKVGKEAHTMRMLTDFPEMAFPMSPDEEAKKMETDFLHNLDTPANVLSRRQGISVEDAKAAILENAAINAELKAGAPKAEGVPGEAGPQPPRPAGLPRLGELIRQKGAKKPEEEKEAEDDGDDGSTP